jgi:hypothetical protein
MAGCISWHSAEDFGTTSNPTAFRGTWDALYLALLTV